MTEIDMNNQKIDSSSAPSALLLFFFHSLTSFPSFSVNNNARNSRRSTISFEKPTEVPPKSIALGAHGGMSRQKFLMKILCKKLLKYFAPHRERFLISLPVPAPVSSLNSSNALNRLLRAGRVRVEIPRQDKSRCEDRSR